MAPGVAAETFGVLSGFAAAAALDVGAWEIPGVMPAILHPGESVLPAPFAAAFRSAVGNGSPSAGGDTYHVTVQAMDAAGVSTFINRYGRQFAAAVSSQVSRNPGLRPTY